MSLRHVASGEGKAWAIIQYGVLMEYLPFSPGSE